jgi:putative membrane protein
MKKISVPVNWRANSSPIKPTITNMIKSLKKYGIIATKGMSMGAVELVPGVSSGTIALLVGVYQELLDSIKSINLSALKLFITFKWKEFWKVINGNFLLSLVLGICISLFSIARLISFLLHAYPILVWAFIFGLMIASVWVIVQDVRQWNWKLVLCFIIGAIAAFFITMATPTQTPDAFWFIFLCGVIAICGMMMPGTSGSFILILLGKYDYMVNAVKSFNMPVLFIFCAGVVIGITSFSRVLSFALRRFHDITIATMSGFILGSLNIVWPWKRVVETCTDSHGNVIPLIKANMLPDQLLWEAIGLAFAGFAFVYLIDKLSKKNKRQ